jgi:hypothetical protein
VEGLSAVSVFYRSGPSSAHIGREPAARSDDPPEASVSKDVPSRRLWFPAKTTADEEVSEFTDFVDERRDSSTLIATDLAARSLDVDGITHVINFDPPPSGLNSSREA